MAADPRGRWYRVYARQIRQHDKFRDLTGLQLGAWTALRSEAELRDESMFADYDDAVLVLKRRKIPNPRGMLAFLIERHLFDVTPAGITVHDREDHDRPKYPSDDPERVRERVARHRETTTGDDSNDSLPARYKNSNEPRARESQPQPTEPAPAADNGTTLKDAADAYYSITGRFPSETVLDWLNRLGRVYGEEPTSRLLSEQYLADSNRRTLLSRTEEALKAANHKRRPTASHDGQHPDCMVCAPLRAVHA